MTLRVDKPTMAFKDSDPDPLLLDPGDWLDSADRDALHQALADSQEDVETGRLFDAEEVLGEVRRL